MPLQALQLEDKVAGSGAGIENEDDGSQPEQYLKLPWARQPELSWIDYRCWVETHLDAGMALHKPLPQQAQRTSPGSQRASLEARTVDTLASGFIDDIALAKNVNGVNLVSGGEFTDVLQRMATSTYRFVVKGFGIRVGYQIPIPGLVSVAGVPATPAERQSAYNVIVGNFAGIPVWFAEWELWYYVTLPPEKAQLPPSNLAQHITGDVQLPQLLTPPQSQKDQNSVSQLRTIQKIPGR